MGQSSLGVPVEDFFENEELARKALSCHLSMDLLCQEMQDAGRSEDYRKVGNDVLEQLSFNSALFRWLVREESVLQTRGLQVLHRVWTVQHWYCCNQCIVGTTPLFQSTFKTTSRGYSTTRPTDALKTVYVSLRWCSTATLAGWGDSARASGHLDLRTSQLHLPQRTQRHQPRTVSAHLSVTAL